MKRSTAAAVTAVALILGTVALCTAPSNQPKETQTMGLQTPGIPSSQIPAGEDHVMRRLADIERYLRELTPSIAKSIQPTVDRLDAADVANAAQDATLAANLASINAIIGNEVAATTAHGDNNAFAVTTTRTTQATQTVTVPAGYTQALIFAEGNASAVNTTGVVDTILVGAAVNGVEPPGWAASQDVAPGGLGGATRAVVKHLTGLTGGGTFTVSTRLYSGIAGWAGNAANICNIDATVVFLR